MAITLEIDGSIQKLREKARTTQSDLEGIAESYDRLGEASKKAIGGASSDQNKLASSTDKARKALKQQDGIIQELEDHLKRLEKGQKKATSVKDITKYNTEIAKTRGALQSLRTAGVPAIGAVNKAATASKGVFSGLRATLATTFAPLFAVGAAVEGIRTVISQVSEFNQTAADLSAITGAQGEALEFLKQSAVEVGVTTTASANQTLEAYKLIASAKPELLSNADALAAITKEAVTLSEASGLELPAAATALTDALNQFSAPAEEAGRFINVLAAGSQQGAAEIPQVTAALLGFGVAAKSSNINVEESVALIETLAEKGVKGAEAGTALRNVLSKLSATELLPKEAVARLEFAGVNLESLSDKSLSLQQRLEALSPIQNDANALTAVFGLENKAAAQIVLQNIDRYEDLKEAITGTSTATDQAATRTATISGEFTKLKNTITAIVQGNGDGIGALVALVIRLAREGLLFLRDRIEDLRPTFQTFRETISGLYEAIRPLLPAQREAGEGASLWSRAVKLANVPIKIFFALLNFGVRMLTRTVDMFGRLTASSPKVGGFFTFIRKVASGMLDVFIDLPLYVEGSLSAIEVFIVEAQRGISQFGSNVGSVIKEAFSFGKLIREGTGDLTGAVQDLLLNPFEGIGGKVRDAFLEPFNAAREEVDKLVKETPSFTFGSDAPADEPTGSGPSAGSAADRKKAEAEAKKRAKEELARLKDIEKAKLEALADGVEKQLAIEQVRYDDLIARLEEYGIETESATYQHELNKFRIKQQFAEQQADLDNLSGEERIQFLYQQTLDEINAIEAALKEANGGELLDEQVKQINLLRKQASETYLEQLEDFQDAETKAAQDHEIALLELKRDEFNSQKEFEEFKQKEILAIRLKYAEAQLQVIESLKGAEDDAALALRKTINTIKGEIASISESGGAAKEFNLFSLFGLDENDPQNKEVIEGIKAAASATVGIISDITEARVKAAEENLKLSEEELDEVQKKIEAKEEQVEREEELDQLGLANDLEIRKEELATLREQEQLKKQERDKALAEKKKAQKAQLLIDTVIQASSLITAAAQIFASVAAIPFVGPILGAALVAGMIGAFASAKAKAFQSVNKQKAEKGMYGRVKGRRHSDGGERFGDHIEVEDGEDFGILSRQASRKFGPTFKAFVQAANKGDKAAMKNLGDAIGERAPVDRDIVFVNEARETEAKQQELKIQASFNNDEQRETNKLLKKQMDKDKAPKKTTEYVDGKKIVKVGNHTRIIRKPNG